jgi:PAS domain S-box-containing protein
MGFRVAQLITDRARSLGRATGAMLESLTPLESVCLVAVGSLQQLDNSRLPLERSLAGACARSTTPLLCNDTESDLRVDTALCRELGVLSLLSMSVPSGPDKTLVLSIVNGQGAFGDRDVHMLEVLMDLLSSAAGQPELTTRSALTALGESGYQQVLDAITDMVLVKGPHSRILWGNKAFREVYGMSNEELCGLIDATFNEPDHTEKYVQNDRHVFEAGKALDIPDEPVTRHDGEVRSYHTVKSPILDRGGRVVMTVGVSRDISERKLLEVELRSAQKLEAIGRLAGGVAHEINTPIQFIGDNTSFLRSGFESLLELYARTRALCERALQERLGAADWSALLRAEDQADLAFVQAECSKAFDSTMHGIAHVTRVVAAMKAFAHTDSADKEALDVNRLLQVTLTIAAHEIREVADVETDFGDLEPVAGFPSELNQVFLNLLVNAAHAIGDAVKAGGPRGRIHVRSYTEGNEVVAAISDTGGGIPLAIQSRIFEPFFTTKEIGRGTGLGLDIAWRIVVGRHGGEIHLESAPGDTRFQVVLPLKVADDTRPA